MANEDGLLMRPLKSKVIDLSSMILKSLLEKIKK